MEAGVTTLRSYVLGRDADPDAVAALPLLMAFEVMYCDGRDLAGRPLRDRRARLGSIRRECLDHVVVVGERHLLGILSMYVDYYNRTRTHLSLAKDTPESGGAYSSTIGVSFRGNQAEAARRNLFVSAKGLVLAEPL
jgi:hypothetical protein